MGQTGGGALRPCGKGARFAAPIDVGPGARFSPIVLGPSAVPVVQDADAARREPELAVLFAIAHAEDPNPDTAARIALAAMVACLEAALLYADVVRSALRGAARVALEALLESPQRRQFQSDFARKYTALGRKEGEAMAVLRILDRRQVALTGRPTRSHPLLR